MSEAKQVANNGWLDLRIIQLKEELGRAEFAKKIAKRNNLTVTDMTGNDKDSNK